ncbi:MAG TPA: CARDB domain-containing protein [Candidatus Paceibacterota bacterium]
MATHTTFRENMLRVIAVLGLIAILLLGAWGIIQLAFYLPTFFSNWGSAKETLSVSVPAQTTSDKAAALSWKHTGKSGEYSYSASYTCAPGLQFAAPVPTGSYQIVACDTPFNYVSASSSMQIIPVLAKGQKNATTTLSVAATRLADGTIAVRGKAQTTVAASTTQATSATTATKPAATKPATTQKPASTYVPSGRTANLYGYADLIVQITSAPESAPAGARVSLQFVVTNIGTNVAPAGWVFNATLPYNPIYVYPSGGQQMLYPGDKIVYTLGYDAVSTNGYNYYGSQSTATINIDTNNYVAESSEANNTASAVYQVY